MPDQYRIAIRNAIKSIRSDLSISQKSSLSNRICARIESLDQYRYAKTVALYSALSNEVSLNAIWHSAPLQGKACYFPVMHSDLVLSFLPATPATAFKKNQYGILEPDVDKSQAIEVDKLDLILVPLVAFDTHCTRLGMGLGCYDRTLESKRPKCLLGLGFQFQLVDYIEPQSWDVPLDAVVTQERVYWR